MNGILVGKTVKGKTYYYITEVKGWMVNIMSYPRSIWGLSKKSRLEWLRQYPNPVGIIKAVHRPGHLVNMAGQAGCGARSLVQGPPLPPKGRPDCEPGPVSTLSLKDPGKPAHI